MKYALRYGVLILLVVIALAVPAWAAFAPIRPESREQIYEIPKGTWARRQAGEKFDLIPAEIRLTLGVRDVLGIDGVHVPADMLLVERSRVLAADLEQPVALGRSFDL